MVPFGAVMAVSDRTQGSHAADLALRRTAERLEGLFRVRSPSIIPDDWDPHAISAPSLGLTLTCKPGLLV